MRRSRVLLAAVLALVLLFAFTASAFATVIPVPDAGYLGATTKINLAPYYWSGVGWPPPLVPAISDGVVTVSFSAPEMFAAYAPELAVHANAWGDDGVVESTTPVPGRTATTAPWAGGVPTTTMTFSRVVKTFGFEVASIWQTGPPSGFTAVVQFKRGGAVIDTITKVIPAPTEILPATYQEHAQFFAATDVVGFDQVVITLSGGAAGHETGAYVAQYRYDLPDPPVIPTPASSAWSLIVLAAAGAALVVVGRKRALAKS